MKLLRAGTFEHVQNQCVSTIPFDHFHLVVSVRRICQNDYFVFKI